MKQNKHNPNGIYFTKHSSIKIMNVRYKS